MSAATKKLELTLQVLWRASLVACAVFALVFTTRLMLANLHTASASSQGPQIANQPASPGNQFRMNNALMQLDVGERDESIAELVTEFEKECEGEAHSETSSDSGMVTCIETDKEIADSLPRFTYVQVGPNGKSNFMKLEPQEEALLSNLMPREGDAPGVDIRSVPRAPNLTRKMSYEDPSGQYQSVFYSSESESPALLLAWYRAELETWGWRLLKEIDASESPHLIAERNGALVMIRTKPGCQNTCVTVTAAGA